MNRFLQFRWLSAVFLPAAMCGVILMAGQPQVARADEISCYNSPSNATCNGITPAPGGWCESSAHMVWAFAWTYPGTGDELSTALWYSTPCRTNWAETFSYYGLADNGVKVRRDAGPDGPYKHYPTGVHRFYDAVSPMVYSPTNLAQACVELPSNDQYRCTPYR